MSTKAGAIQAATDDRSINLARLPADQVQAATTLAENRTRSLTVFASAAADHARTVKLAASDGSHLSVGIGAEFLDLGAGDVDLTLAAGETAVTFALIERGDIDQDSTLELTATLIDAAAPAGSAAVESRLSVNLDGNEESERAATRLIENNGPYGEYINPYGVAAYLNHTDTVTNRTDDRVTEFIGSAHNDTIRHGHHADTVQAGAGNDWIGGYTWAEIALDGEHSVAGGTQRVSGGDGDDVIANGGGDGRLAGDAGNDLLDGAHEHDLGYQWRDGNGDTFWSDEIWRAVGQSFRPEFSAGEKRVRIGEDAVDVALHGGSWSNRADGSLKLDGRATSDSGSGRFKGDQRDNGDGTRYDSYDFDYDAVAGGLTIRYGGEFGGYVSRYDIGYTVADLAPSAMQTRLTLDGGAGDDALIANDGGNLLIGGDGADLIQGGAGSDTVFGDAGPDDEDAQAPGADQIVLGAGDDYADAGQGDDLVAGEQGDDAVYGGAGNDVLLGDTINAASAPGGSDYLDGEEGDDVLIGGGGDDALVGGAGNDTLFGDGNQVAADDLGADYLDGGDGDDYLGGGGGSDELFGRQGNDTLAGAEGDDYLEGGVGDDSLMAEGGEDILVGGDGSDSLSGGDDNDVLVGGVGADALNGGDGDDLYLLSTGDGATTVSGAMEALTDAAGDDTLRFGDGISADALRLSAANGVVAIRYSDDDSIAIVEGIDGVVERYEFADGTVLGWEELAAKGFDVSGADGDDELAGTRYEDRMAGGSGDDLLMGGTGNDTYLFNSGDGHDTIDDGDGANIVSLGAGITLAGTTVTQGIGDDGERYVDLHFGNGDWLSLRNGEQGGIAAVRFADGTELTHAQLLQRLDSLDQVGSDVDETMDGTGGNDTLAGGAGNDTLNGNAGDDSLDGEAGDDRLSGGVGTDRYYLSLGMGHDTVFENSGETSRLYLDPGVAVAGLSHGRTGDDLIIRFRDGTSSMTIAGYYGGGQDWQVERQDGTALSMTEFLDAIDAGPADVAKAYADHKANILSSWQSHWKSEGATRLGAEGSAALSHDAMSEAIHATTSSSFTTVFDKISASDGRFDESITTSASAVTRSVRATVKVSFSSARESMGSGAKFIRADGRQSGGGRGGVDYSSEPVYVRGENGRITGAWYYPPGWTPSTGSGFPIPITRAEYVYASTVHVMEVTGDAQANTLIVGGRGLIDGSAGDDTLIADVSMSNPISSNGIRNLPGAFLYGNDGNDTVCGGNDDDVLVGGRGSDNLDGGNGADTFLALENDGVDQVSDYGGDFGRYRDWYFRSKGITDIPFHETYGGRWVAQFDGLRAFDSFDEAASAIAQTVWLPGVDEMLASGALRYVAPLPELRAVAGNDYTAAAVLAASGAILTDKIVFGEGISAAGIAVSGGQEVGYIKVIGEDGSGVQIALPGANDLVGSGIELVEFADGSRLTLAQLMELANGDHELAGTVSNETLAAGDGEDSLDGGDGDDTLYGGGGDDTLRGGSGVDSLDGGTGADRYVFGGGSGIDTVIDEADNQVEVAGSLGIADAEFRIRYGGNWMVENNGWHAFASRDDAERFVADYEMVPRNLAVEEGWTALEESGRFRYVEPLDAAVLPSAIDFDVLDDLVARGVVRADRIVFGAGVSRDNLEVSGNPDQGFLLLQAPDGCGANVRVARSGDRIGTGIEQIEFADGSFMSVGEAVLRANSDHSITGTENDDSLVAGAGNDTLAGISGNDTLDGGRGNDVLKGGEGSDTYVFERGYGHDSIVDVAENGSVNRLQIGFTTGIDSVDSVRFARRNGNDLVVTVDGWEGDSVTVANWFSALVPGRIDEVVFPVWDSATNDWVRMGASAIGAVADAANTAPVQEMAVDNLRVESGRVLSWQVPSGTFVDRDGDPLHFVLRQSSGAPLPDWLHFDPQTCLLSGMPSTGDIGTLEIEIVASDDAGHETSCAFLIEIAQANSAPQLVAPLLSQTVTEASPWQFVVPAGTFTDIDAGDSLSYSTTLANGDPLPAWLGFDAATQTLSGTPVAGQLGNLAVRIVATDLAGASASADFALSVTAAPAQTLTGGTGSDTLVGLSGNDTLDGGAGADIMKGGRGADTYYVDNVGDVIEEVADGSWDVVYSSVSYTLGAALNELHLTGTADIDGTGDGSSNRLYGNVGRNVLTGKSGNDLLDGGAGADTLVGGLGNDTYVADNLGDLVTEKAGEGTDTVQSSVGWTLGAHIENLTLTGTADIDGSGNELANILLGNDGANVLDGKAGADTLKGGKGADTYYVDNVGDVIDEVADGSWDIVYSSVSYGLTDPALNELRLTGSGALDGTGNAGNNRLVGNDGANVLDGKEGADTMNGGKGADTYYVDNVGDTIVDAADGSWDKVYSSVSYSLTDASLNELRLTGSSVLDGTGNAGGNYLYGNAAANTLSGLAGNDRLDGGAGNDILIGGTGNDTYQLGIGYGADMAREDDATAGNLDVAKFMAGVAYDQIWFRHVGNDLEASVIGRGDSLTFANWYQGSRYHVEEFRTTDGNKLLTDAKVENLVQAMAAFAPPAAGQTTLPQNYRDTLAPVLAANWQ